MHAAVLVAQVDPLLIRQRQLAGSRGKSGAVSRPVVHQKFRVVHVYIAFSFLGEIRAPRYARTCSASPSFPVSWTIVC